MNTCEAEKLCCQFGLTSKVVTLELIPLGHINDTFDVVLEDGKHLILQRINTNIFKQPEGIMDNINMIARYLEQGSTANLLPHYYCTAEGKNYVIDEGFWRLCDFVPDSVCYDTFDDMGILEAGGRAFGFFQNALCGFPSQKLYVTIPNFHNTEAYFRRMEEHIQQDPAGRVKDAVEEIAVLARVREKATRLSRMTEKGELPLRVTHNDTKTNNILFRKGTREPAAVIDLDTVMPGLSVHDFGDAIRYAANTAAEDEKDLSKVHLDMEKYAAFARGFLGATATTLTEAELQNMALGAYTMTAELVVRFLDDYLVGDTYFKIAYPEHNLVRARSQLALLMSMEENWDAMCAVAEEICREVRGGKA